MTSVGDFDDLLQQLKIVSENIDDELSDLRGPKQLFWKSSTHLINDCDSDCQSNATAQFRWLLPEFCSASAQELLTNTERSNSSFDVQRLPHVKASRVREKHDYSCCWFLPSSKCQTNVEQNDAIKTSAPLCEEVSGRQCYQLSKSLSDKSAVKVSQSDKNWLSSPTNNSLSHNGSPSATAVENIDNSVDEKSTKFNFDKVSNYSSNFRLEQAQPGSSMKAQSSSEAKLHLDISLAQQGMLSPCRPVRTSPSSVPTATPKICFFDPTKYQLRHHSVEITSERRSVPHMGSQRLATGSSPCAHRQSNSPPLIAESHVYSNEPLNYQGNPNNCVQASIKKEIPNALNSSVHSLDNGIGISLPYSSSSSPAARSTFDPVTQRPNLENESHAYPVKVRTTDQDDNTAKLITWIMNPNDAIPPFGASVVGAQMNSRGRTTGDCKCTQQNRSREMKKFPLSDIAAKLKVKQVADDSVMRTAGNDQLISDNMIAASQKLHQLDHGACARRQRFNYNKKVETWMNNNNSIMLSSADNISGHLMSERESQKVGADDRPSSTLKHPEFNSKKSISFEASTGAAFNGDVNFSYGAVKRSNSTASASVLMNVTNDRRQQVNTFGSISNEVDLNRLAVDNSERDPRSVFRVCCCNERLLKNCHSTEQISHMSLLSDHSRFKSKSDPPLHKELNDQTSISRLTENPDSVELSRSIANLQNLFSSCDDFIQNSINSQENLDSRCLGSQPSLTSRSSSSETLQDPGDNDIVLKNEFSSIDNTKKISTSCLKRSEQTNIPNDHSQTDDVFDQNNNQFFDDESSDGWESELFGTLGSDRLDLCYKWEWDSPTSTLQHRIERPAYGRNHSAIPIVDDQTGKLNKSYFLAEAQDSSPAVIPPFITDAQKRRQHEFPGAKICRFIVNLASEEGFFGAMIQNFVQCTMASSEMKPHIVIRNIRQFIDGLKNYLMQKREKKLDDFVKQECFKIKSGEFLNMDTITEHALHKCVLKPLYSYVQRLFVHDFTRNGNLLLMSDGIKSSKSNRLFKSDQGSFALCLPKSVEIARQFLQKMTETWSPLKKLEYLISAMSVIGGNVKRGGSKTRWSEGSNSPARTDALLANLMYILAEHEMTWAEIEADYMWGLVHSSCLTGKTIFYLTLFSSAIGVVKKLSKSQMENSLQSICTDGLVKIQVPDEKYDNIWTKMLPFWPNSTATEMCQMMAYKLNITNPQEYGLFVIKDSEEIRLNDNVCLSEFRTIPSADLLLAYKRINVKLIWPVRR